MKQCFKPKKFNEAALDMIQKANDIVEQYAAMGYDLTLRQLYYQCVSHDLFPSDRKWAWTGSRWVRDSGGTINAEPNYKWLGDVIGEGRLAGLVRWDRIVDRSRTMQVGSHWSSPADIIRSAAAGFRIDKWSNQDWRPQVWVEKEALLGIIGQVCSRNDVSHIACKGYMSLSEMFSAAQSFKQGAGQKHLIIHLGDHDPSGIDMTRDIDDRMAMFGATVKIKRIALNMDQINALNPPPNPAKMTDSRFNGYSELYGDESWELDALDPPYITTLIQDAINEVRDKELWEKKLAQENDQRRRLFAAHTNWSSITQILTTLEQDTKTFERESEQWGRQLAGLALADEEEPLDAEPEFPAYVYAQPSPDPYVDAVYTYPDDYAGPELDTDEEIESWGDEDEE